MKKNKTPAALEREAAHRAEADKIRTAKALAKAEKIAAVELEREQWRAQAIAAGRRFPPEFGDWGYIKTKAWIYFASRCIRASGQRKPSQKKLEGAIADLNTVVRVSAAQCAAMLEQHKAL
jgi:hypothetical protein